MDLSIIIVEPNGNLKETIFKKMDENTLYKKCNLKKPDDFEKKTEWKVNIDSTTYFVTLFAKEKGRANNENKYDFPPPVDNPIFFGNCALFAKDLDGYIDLKIPLWIKIYEKLFGGFENLDQTAEEDDNEEDELDNVADELKSKDGYLKDDFVVDEEIEDDDDDEDDEEDSWDDDDDNDVSNEDEDDSDEDEMLDELGSELSTEMYEYSDEDD